MGNRIVRPSCRIGRDDIAVDVILKVAVGVANDDVLGFDSVFRR